MAARRHGRENSAQRPRAGEAAVASGRTAGIFSCLLAAAAIALGACDKKAEPPAAPTSMPTPEPGYAGVPEAAPALPESSSEAPVGPVEAPAQVNMDAADAENQLVKTEVLARIDVMPKLSPEEKDKLYVLVERARGMGRIVTIPFSSGKIAIGPAEVAALKEKIALPQIKKFSDDPTVVFVVLGYADKKGDPKKNVAISLDRAESVVNALKDRLGVMNVVHAVGMGSSELFDAQNLDKNRVVEVWAVLP
jgi:outer membrane protein OmpA-like peptidoglycan-associated protein